MINTRNLRPIEAMVIEEIRRNGGTCTVRDILRSNFEPEFQTANNATKIRNSVRSLIKYHIIEKVGTTDCGGKYRRKVPVYAEVDG